MNKQIIILGAGITGLATAHWLNKKGYDIMVLESGSEVGGSMISEKDAGYLIDYGPNSGLETSEFIKELVNDLNLEKQFIYANKEGNKRYILKNNSLIPLPTSPKDFLSSKLFSTKAKLRLTLEPFIGKSDDGYYQSISEFVTRRLGREFLDYAINPFVAGVYAGNPDKLSVKSAFPKLYRLEEVYGGLIKGTIKGAKERRKRGEQSKQNAAMFSFNDGMATLPKAISANLSGKVKLSTKVTGIRKENNKYIIQYEQNNELNFVTADIVISTVPAYVASKIFGNLDTKLSDHLNSVYYPPVMVLYLGYKKESIRQVLDGFGFLIPEKEKKQYLGALWSSVIFNNRANNENASFTIFIGGARSPKIFDKDSELIIKDVIKEFSDIMGINSEPEFIKFKLWEKAIPQYNTGYIEHLNYFEDFEMRNRGIVLGGNYIGGISVGDCIKSSNILAEKGIKILNNIKE